MLVCVLLASPMVACASRSDATTGGSVTASGARGVRRASAAADIPNVDVRRLPPERKAALPDIMLRAADLGRVLGADTAPIHLVVITDLQCAACKRWHDTQWPVIHRDYVDRGLVRVTLTHYPLREHRQAVLAASAAMCASAQHKFWPAIDALFALQSRWAVDAAPARLIDSLAAVPGVDRRALEECTGSRRLWRQLRADVDWADVDWADADGADALPILVIGARRLRAPTSLAQLRAVLDSARAGK